MAKDIDAVKVVAFDMFGTLFDVHSVVQACRDAFGSEGEEFSKFWRAKQLQYTWLRALMGRYVPFWQITQDSLDVAMRQYGKGDDTALRQRLLDTYKEVRPYPDAGPALDALAELGRQRVILTNGSRDMVNSALAAAKFEDKFNDVFSVADVGTYKPNPAVYEMAQAKLGVDAGEVLMVSSHPWDLAGAISFGFQGVWINRPGAGNHLESIGYDPDYQVTGLDALAELLSKKAA